MIADLHAQHDVACSPRRAPRQPAGLERRASLLIGVIAIALAAVPSWLAQLDSSAAAPPSEVLTSEPDPVAAGRDDADEWDHEELPSADASRVAASPHPGTGDVPACDTRRRVPGWEAKGRAPRGPP